MNGKLKDSNVDFLFKAVLALENIDECYDFFEDLCTVTELKALSLNYGCDGYEKIFERIDAAEAEKKD